MPTNSIGSFIAALRKANGLTQKQLGEKLNVSDKAISRWERDECAPDLSLIPVIAEIFGVTSDELLRGQRAAPDATPTPQAEEKSKKRLQYLLDKLLVRFKITSVISISIALIGVIAAMLLNAYNRAQAGFLVGCVFFLASTVCQIIFLNLGSAELRGNDFDEEAVTTCRNNLIKRAEWVFSIITVMLFITLPLALVDDYYYGLTFPFEWSMVFVCIPAILCPVICFAINGKLGLRKPMYNATRRLSIVMLILFVVTLLCHGLFANYLVNNPQFLSEGTKCETFEEYKQIMETPLGYDGEALELVEEEDGIRYYRSIFGDEYTVYWEDYSIYQIWNANFTIRNFFHDGEVWYLYTAEQYATLLNRYTIAHILFALLYPLEIVTGILLYRKKMRALSSNA